MAVNCHRTRNLDAFLLRVQNIEHITKSSMQALLRDVRSDVASFVQAAEFSDVSPYGRRLLIQTSTIEALVMGFYPWRECAAHDHGGSDGLVLVCSGTAEHRIYHREGGNLTPVERTLESAGSILDAPVDCVHSMGNPGPGLLVTLHLYWPPISQMTLFDLKERVVYQVNGTAGAWLPVAAETLISCIPIE